MYFMFKIRLKVGCSLIYLSAQLKQESPADAMVTRDIAIIPRWPSAAILDIVKPQIAPFDPPTPKTLA